MARRGQVPACVVFNNKTLEALTRHRPTTAEVVLVVPGVGETKAARYLRPFLEAV